MPEPTFYERHFSDCGRERAFLAAAGFTTAFAAARGITHAIRAGRGPFHNISAGGTHIHHSTFGIFGLLGIGFFWVHRVALGPAPGHRWPSRVSATAYGVAAALTLDEFALWLNLQDDYWSKQGRESIDAVVMFGAFLSAGASARNHIADIGRRARRRLSHPSDS